MGLSSVLGRHSVEKTYYKSLQTSLPIDTPISVDLTVQNKYGVCYQIRLGRRCQ